jgi:hypothetical protein
VAFEVVWHLFLSLNNLKHRCFLVCYEPYCGFAPRSGGQCLHPLLRTLKLPKTASPPLLMVLVQVSDRRLLQPFIRRAISDNLHVALVLKVDVGQSRQEELEQRLKLGPIQSCSARFDMRGLTFHVGEHVFPRFDFGCWRSLLLARMDRRSASPKPTGGEYTAHVLPMIRAGLIVARGPHHSRGICLSDKKKRPSGALQVRSP